MKIVGNWALGITVLYVGFALFMVGFLVVSTFHKVDLVEDNYYDKEIAYQQHIDKVKRTKALVHPLTWKRENKTLVLQFPKDLGNLGGTIKLYRPSDAKHDLILPVNPDESGVQGISLSALERGLWRMRVDWKSGNVTYYNEDVIFIE